ncbi:MAG: hypothetical protein HYU64_03325 [Armatimonadetes bacterium]|nr:hypothetical protein [Armatimonadota bacterium]
MQPLDSCPIARTFSFSPSSRGSKDLVSDEILPIQEARDWLVAPLFPEKEDLFVLPVYLPGGSWPLYLDSRGRAVVLPSGSGETVHIKGDALGEDMDYRIRQDGRTFTLDGDTGKTETHLRILATDNTLEAKGTAGDYNVDYKAEAG